MIRDDFRYNVAIDVVLFSLLVIVSTFEVNLIKPSEVLTSHINISFYES